MMFFGGFVALGVEEGHKMHEETFSEACWSLGGPGAWLSLIRAHLVTH